MSVRDVHLHAATVRHCNLGAAAVEDCTVDGLKCLQPVFTRGAVFRHVVLKGRIGSLVLSGQREPGRYDSTFEAERQAWYAATDWALDIRQADLVDADLLGVPADKVRFDPERAGVVRRATVELGAWRSIADEGTGLKVGIERLLQSRERDTVLALFCGSASEEAAGRRVLQRLRDAGIVESA